MRYVTFEASVYAILEITKYHVTGYMCLPICLFVIFDASVIF